MNPAQVRRLARSAALEPERAARGHFRFSFRDLVLLRAAAELEAAGISAHRVHRSLRDLRSQLPAGRPLTAVRIVAEGDDIIVHDGRRAWNPDSGQVQLELEVADLAERVAPLDRRAAKAIRARERRLEADDWYELGCALEISAPLQATAAFRRATELDPGHADAHVNLGYLLHEQGRLAEAESECRAALAARPDNATAAYNLGVVLEDDGRPDEAIQAYERALEAEPALADAHFNLSRLYEQRDDRSAALRHLHTYSELIRTP